MLTIEKEVTQPLMIEEMETVVAPSNDDVYLGVYIGLILVYVICC